MKGKPQRPMHHTFDILEQNPRDTSRGSRPLRRLIQSLHDEPEGDDVIELGDADGGLLPGKTLDGIEADLSTPRGVIKRRT